MKLKSIFAYTKDYKMILEMYKKGGLQKWLYINIIFWTKNNKYMIKIQNMY